MRPFDGVKVFSGTMASDREAIGERITVWLRENSAFELVERVVLQSSDERHHCLTIVLFYRVNPAE